MPLEAPKGCTTYTALGPAGTALLHHLLGINLTARDDPLILMVYDVPKSDVDIYTCLACLSSISSPLDIGNRQREAVVVRSNLPNE